jgi:hypothetical protein
MAWRRRLRHSLWWSILGLPAAGLMLFATWEVFSGLDRTTEVLERLASTPRYALDDPRAFGPGVFRGALYGPAGRFAPRAPPRAAFIEWVTHTPRS